MALIFDDPAMIEGLAELRAHAESAMTSTCVVRPVVGVEPDAIGQDVVTYGAVVYSGCCKVQDLSPSREVESGSATVTVVSREVHVPVGAGPFEAGMVVFVDGESSPSWRILAPHTKTWQTAQRLPVERVP